MRSHLVPFGGIDVFLRRNSKGLEANPLVLLLGSAPNFSNAIALYRMRLIVDPNGTPL